MNSKITDNSKANSVVVGRALHILKDGMAPFVTKCFPDEPVNDIAHMLKLISFRWNELPVGLERRARTLAHELIDTRNEWAHQVPLSDDDRFRALDSIERLLKSIGDQERMEEVRQMKLGPSGEGQGSEKAPPTGTRERRIVRVRRPASEPGRYRLTDEIRKLREIPFSTGKDSERYALLERRLNDLTSQVYGSADVKAGRFARCITSHDFGWMRESRVEPYEEGDREFLRILMHIGDTKEQGGEFFRLNPNGLQWPKEVEGFELRTRPFIKISNAHASAILWICPRAEESTRTHTLTFFQQFAGRVPRGDWTAFDDKLSNFIDGWKEKCVARDGFDPISWDDQIVNSNRSLVLLSVGTQLGVLVPYEVAQDLDDPIERSGFANKYRHILETIKALVESRFKSEVSFNENN